MKAHLLALLAAATSLASATLLREKLTVEGIFGHLEELEKIAALDGLNSRSVRTNYNASAEYVISQLSSYCDISLQHFVVPVHQELAAPTLAISAPYSSSFQHGVDFQGMRYGGSGSHNITAPLTEVKGGCSSSDFSSFPRGNVALIQEGGCELVEKAFLAEEFGASAILFYNQASRTTLLTTRVRIVAWKEGDPLVKKPVLALSNLAGKTLGQSKGTVVSLTANMLLTTDHTYNVICDSRSGSKDNVVMAGAHLDSVPEGPGLNDNGSGSSSLLEIALVFFQSGISHANAVRFAWWGAEEIGLLGSRHYVRELSENDPAKLAKIALYINFDMLGSPNFIPYVHDGYRVGDNIPEDVKYSSRKVQELFEDFFQESSLPYELNDMLGGSDFLPFLEGGIPSSGLATGASAIKSAAQREKFGGLANAAFDPCYHLPCDTVLNVSSDAIFQCASAAADVIYKLSTMKNLREYLSS